MKKTGIIDLSLITKEEQIEIARRFLPLIEKFYNDPKN
jgi:hypothetical protein